MDREDKLPFEDKEFDIALLNHALHHCRQWRATIDEARRVSRALLIVEIDNVLLSKVWEAIVVRVKSLEFYPENLKTIKEWGEYLGRIEYRLIKRSLSYPLRQFVIKIGD